MTTALLAALALASASAAASPQVTLPLEEYERLRRLEERPALTVVESLRVEGSFGRRDLAVALAGRASGTLPRADVLEGAGFRLHACEGDALVSRTDEGAFAVTPLAPRFRVRCRLALDGSDRLAARAGPAVLDVEARVEDGELVLADGAGGARELTVVRRLAGEREELPPSVAARYRVTLLPDETRFAWRLDVRNPSRGTRTFELPLRAEDHVETVDAPVAWDVEGTRYRFRLPPGETSIGLTGRLGGDRFVPPVAGGLQYLLLESHPLVRAEARTAWKRVGPAETGLVPEQRGAQAFLLGKEGGEVAWTATRLEALKTAGFAVDGLQQVWFLGADGKVRGETTLAVNNQGAAQLALPLAGSPTFASVGGEPAFLTQDGAKRLLLPLAAGVQEVRVQDEGTLAARLGLAVARLELPRAGVAASEATVQLRYPQEWVPVYEEFAPAVRWHLPRAADWAAVALATLAAGVLLGVAGVRGRRRAALLVPLAALALLSEDFRAAAFVAAALPLAGLAAWTLWQRTRGLRRLAVAGVAGAALLLVAGALDLGVVGRTGRSNEYGSGGYASNLPKTLQFGSPAQERRAEARAERILASQEGLPARIELPPGARRSTFTREMLGADAPRPVVAVLVAARALAALTTFCALALLATAFLLRRELAAGARAVAERFRTAGAPAVAQGGAPSPA
jgi:hypothetical protein